MNILKPGNQFFPSENIYYATSLLRAIPQSTELFTLRLVAFAEFIEHIVFSDYIVYDEEFPDESDTSAIDPLLLFIRQLRNAYKLESILTPHQFGKAPFSQHVPTLLSEAGLMQNDILSITDLDDDSKLFFIKSLMSATYERQISMDTEHLWDFFRIVLPGYPSEEVGNLFGLLTAFDEGNIPEENKLDFNLMLETPFLKNYFIHWNMLKHPWMTDFIKTGFYISFKYPNRRVFLGKCSKTL